MMENIVAPARPDIELPAGAPLVRMTAGVGSAHQKTWNVRRPVTLIGSCRPAHIVLHDHDVAKAHCVLVNTGQYVLLKDLHTSSGTFRNNARVDLALLKDGDVLTVGTTCIQIAIRATEENKDDSGCGMEFVDPLKFSKPFTLRLDHTDTYWRLEDTVAMIGRHADAEVRIDHPEVSTRHALLFLYVDGQAIFDLGGRTGTRINGACVSLAVLRHGNRIGLGPCILTVATSGASSTSPPATVLPPKQPSVLPKPQSNPKPAAARLALDGPAGASERREGVAPASGPALPFSAKGIASTSPGTALPPLPRALVAAQAAAPSDPGGSLLRVETDLLTLQRNITESWEHMSRWQEQLRNEAQKLNQQSSDLSARQAELDARDAAARGQLHNLTRFQEQLAARELELAAQLARMQEEQDALTLRQSDLTRSEGEISRQGEELQRREHVVTQRWTRLLNLTCPHCGQAVRPSNQETSS